MASVPWASVRLQKSGSESAQMSSGLFGSAYWLRLSLAEQRGYGVPSVSSTTT